MSDQHSGPDDAWETLVDLARLRGIDTALARLQGMGNSEETIQQLRARYIEETTRIQTGFPPNIVVAPSGQGWYAGPRPDDRYWPKLLAHHRAEGRLSDTALDQLDQATSKIISYTADPSRSKWTTKGLVVGYVQSGKTTNFTGVIAKAVDVGYNFVIVLTGIHEGLRNQTQDRLEAQLCDLDRQGWKPFTTIESDFRRPTMALESQIQDGSAGLIVAKKNAAVLRKIDRWVSDAANRGGMANVRALIIDDEADQASIDTATINPLIRRIISRFPRVTFIGYTATPFANVFDDAGTSDSLYPKDFIVNLPLPDGYFGTETIFGRDELPEAGETEPVDGYDMVRQVPDNEAATLIPRRNQVFNPTVTATLRSAIRWFALATAARRAAGDDGHSTMLIHTSMKVDAHEALRGPVEDEINQTIRDLAAGDVEIVGHLRAQWEREIAAVPPGAWNHTAPPFADVLDKLPEVLRQIAVILDNSRSADRLDYKNGPVTAIAVGGNTLSRGLTLEGLVVSFFVRAAGAYDTLLQMGRWFGFRTGYEYLPRMYLTNQLRDWFRHLSSVEHELRRDISFLETQALTPVEYGPRIRTHPALRITTKMGNNVRQAYVSYGGRRVQVRYFRHTDSNWLGANVAAASLLVAAADADPSVSAEERNDGSVVWRNVPVGQIIPFLDRYQVHEDSPDLDRDLLRKYIENEVGDGSLTHWSVAVLGLNSSTNGEVTLGARTFGRIVRSRLRDDHVDRADIKTLGSKEDRITDMLPLAGVTRRTPEEELARLRQADPLYSSRGLLVLYPIDPDSPPATEAAARTRTNLDAVDDVIGLALIFPGNAKQSVRNSYVSNDLSNAEIEDPDDINDLLNGDDTPDQ